MNTETIEITQPNRLSCPVCNQKFSNPCSLQCGHSFCFKCIPSCSPTTPQISCPLCLSNQPTFTQPPINLTLKEAIELHNKLTTTPSTPPCECGHSNSIKYCPKCETFLCKTCFQGHSSVPFTKNHTTVDPKERTKAHSKCPQHQEVMKAFCMNCKRYVCPSCLLFHIDHKETILITEDAAIQQREGFIMLIDYLKQRHQTIQSNVYIVDEEIDKTKAKLVELTEKKAHSQSTCNNLQLGIDVVKQLIGELKEDQLLDYVEELMKLVRSVYSKSSNSTFLRSFGSKGSKDAQLHFPYNVVITKGTFLVADCDNKRIAIYNSNGTFLQSLGLGGFVNPLSRPTSVAVDSKGNIFVADFGACRIAVFNSNGIFLRTFGSKGSAAGQFNGPWGIAVDTTDSVIYVTDFINHQINVFNSNGTFIRKFGSLGREDGKLDTPYGITVDTNGIVYVADGFNHRIVLFNSDGTFLRKFGSKGSGDGQLNNPCGVAVDGKTIYVADHGNHRIVVFTADGIFLHSFGSYGAGDGQLNFPSGVVVDANGDIFVADKGNNRIVVFNLTFKM